MGNPASIQNMIQKLGSTAVISMDNKSINSADAIILPGVGAFDNGMTKLAASDSFHTLQHKVIEEKIPFLGICLGMQLLFETSEEGKKPGLGWISGEVKRFDFTNQEKNKYLKIPHMGWNDVKILNPNKLLDNLEVMARFYFVHSYHVVCKHSEHIIATTFYGYEFTSVVNKENIWGTQFHPEKSHRYGLMLLSNFLNLIKC
jgi:glutamine amidotransferase